MTESSEPSGRCLGWFRYLGVFLVGGNLAQLVLVVVLFPFFKGDVPSGGPPRVSYLLHAASAVILLPGRPFLIAAPGVMASSGRNVLDWGLTRFACDHSSSAYWPTMP